MQANEFLAQQLANYIFAVRGQPAVYCGPGMICDPSIAGQSLKNGLLPVRFTKFWAKFTRAAATTDPYVLDTTQTLHLLNSGLGDAASYNGWATGNLTLADTNLPKGGALGETGFVYFLLGMSISMDAVVVATTDGGTTPADEYITRGILTCPWYVKALVETVINMGVLTATSDDGNDMRAGLISLYQGVGGAIGDGIPMNGGAVSLPGTFFPFARPLACGDKNSGNKLDLTLTFPRARKIEVVEVTDLNIMATGGATLITAVTNENTFVKGTIVFYGIQLCMPDVALCGVPANFPQGMGAVPGAPQMQGNLPAVPQLASAGYPARY